MGLSAEVSLSYHRTCLDWMGYLLLLKVTLFHLGENVRFRDRKGEQLRRRKLELSQTLPFPTVGPAAWSPSISVLHLRGGDHLPDSSAVGRLIGRDALRRVPRLCLACRA